MRYSKLFGQTTRSAPSEASAISYKLLHRAGCVRMMSPGRYSILPLGQRIWSKIVSVIEDEMASIACQRMLVPTLHSIDVWRKSHRDQAFGDLMLLVEDHQRNTFALGATAEGMVVELVKKFSPSYKDLPILIYQFSRKFRDEKRPRGGLLRLREFIMKDAYSFCRDEAQSLKIYQKFFDSYLRIAEKLDLEVLPVEVDSGAIGGDFNHEFIVPCDVGESSIFVCNKCDYAASEERATFIREELNPGERMRQLKVIDQPAWVKTMDDNIEHYGEPLWRYLKNVVYRTSENNVVVASVRGDQEVNEAKLRRYLGVALIEPATEDDLAKFGTKPGYVHSWGIDGVMFVGDYGLTKVKNFIGGHKTDSTDTIDVNYGRDFEYADLADIAKAKGGDSCPSCARGRLVSQNGIEFGHCFKQDLFYTKPQGGLFVGEDGEPRPMWMGAYGIGIERAMAAIVETHHDDEGIIWPSEVSPFQVHLISLDGGNEKVRNRSEEIYEALVGDGVDTLFDDRSSVSAGVKLKDADLLGIPWRMIVSEKSLQRGGVELKRRNDDKAQIYNSNRVLSMLD
jgi:prolyl-tRNA synthetase